MPSKQYNNHGVTGPTLDILTISQSNLASSSSPSIKPTLNTTPITPITPINTTTTPTTTTSFKSPTSPVSTLDSSYTTTPNTPTTTIDTFQPVQMDSLLALVLDICSNTSLLFASLKIPPKSSQLISQLEVIKDELMARQDEIKAKLDSLFMERCLWNFSQCAHRLNSVVSKLRQPSLFSSLSSSSSSRKAKVEKYFKHFLISWQELMVNFSLSLVGGNTILSTPSSTANMSCLQGDKYLFGYGVSKSYDLAFKCYQKAAMEDECAEAYNMMGCMFEYGLGRCVDMKKSIDYYRIAVGKKYADAMNNLGRIYETGPLGIDKNYNLAVEQYVAASNLGHLDAMVNLGFLLEHGVGGTQLPDFDKAESWYKQASEKNYARAQNCLGALYYKQGGGDKDQEAFKLFCASAEQGNAHAFNNLGICYEEGRGTLKDLEKAMENYGKAMELNHPSGTNNYGYLLLLKKKYLDAAKYFNIAAALGSSDALFNLGALYESGCLHPSKSADYDMAVFYYTEAALKGHEKAKARVSTRK